MCQIVDNDRQAEFLDRFYGFCDSVIRSVSIRYNNGKCTLELRVSTRDSLTQLNEGWVCVVMLVDGVSEFTLAQPSHTTLQVISHGINLVKLDDHFGIEFGGAVDPPRSLSELHKSDAYVVGKVLSFDVCEY